MNKGFHLGVLCIDTCTNYIIYSYSIIMSSIHGASEYVEDISFNDTTEETKELKIVIPFWTQDPNVLLQYPLEFFPVDPMNMEQKLNALSRLIILLTIVAFIVTKNVRILFVTFLTLAAIAYFAYVQITPEKKVRFSDKLENFETGILPSDESPVDVLVRENNFETADVFADPSSTNPFNNNLITDYERAESKRPAPPAYSDETNQLILEQTKNMISESNPEQPLINNKLFRSLEDDFKFEQSMRPFYSNPSTTIPNDQGSFADFCYGSMISCKEGNPFACARNLARHTNT